MDQPLSFCRMAHRKVTAGRLRVVQHAALRRHLARERATKPMLLRSLSRQRSPTSLSGVRWPMEISFARHQFPPDIIRHAVWLYLRFALSFRDVEDLLTEGGLDVSYETVR
jgi:hypothetical protein